MWRVVKQMLQPFKRGTIRPTYTVNLVSRGIGSTQSKALWARECCVL